jgi:DNA-binding MarR family transcriptional regulator
VTDPTQPTADVPWLDDEQLRDWKALVGLLMTLPPALDAQLKRDTGLNMFEYHVLAALSEAPNGALPMSELAVMSRGSRSRLSHAVSRLESAGWVDRRSCAEAGLRTAAHLTDAGRRKLEESAPGHAREARRLVVDLLTPEQLSSLGSSARAIVQLTAPELADRMADDHAACGEELRGPGVSSAAG